MPNGLLTSNQRGTAQGTGSALVRGSIVAKPKRDQVQVACNKCRGAKTKCDASRPSCQRCRKHNYECRYDTEPGSSRSMALKEKCSNQEAELQSLRQLYESIRSCPESEVHDLVQEIRWSTQPWEALRRIQKSANTVHRTLPNPLPSAATRALDTHALQNSEIKVPARPWTSVAGDGIVSHLISQFFELEHPFLTSHIDREVFIEEMIEADVTKAEFCTPLLVNSICALASFASVYSDPAGNAAHGSGTLRDRFFDETRKLLDNEAGKPSLPTAQALALMFLYCSSDARDQAGIMFRLAAAEMYKRLRIGDAATPAIRSRYPAEKVLRLFSRAVWGLFCQETKICFGDFQRSLIGPPKIPRYFAQQKSEEETWAGDLDALLDAHCNISLHMYQMSLLGQAAISSTEDFSKRQQIWVGLTNWLEALPGASWYPLPLRRFHHFLRSLYWVSMILLIRPLRAMERDLASSFQDPADLLVTHSEGITTELRLWESVYPRDFERGSDLTMWLYYMNAFTLLPLLENHPRAQNSFVQSCRFFYKTSHHWPACDAVLEGLRAVSQETCRKLPQACELYLIRANSTRKAEHFPVSWKIQEEADFARRLSDDDCDSDDIGMELGKVIMKWSA